VSRVSDVGPELRSRFVAVDGIRTHYLEGGDGRPVVLLHSGEHGASAALSWERLIPTLTRSYRVIAPDWLGFGETDKLHDFGGGQDRRLRHMTRFLEIMAIQEAAFVGNSMGASLLLRVAAADHPVWPIAAIVTASGGGFAPDNAARRATLDYRCTREGMRAVVGALFHDPRYALDDDLVERRFQASIRPGAWEALEAARLRNPLLPERSEFGHPDTTDYARINAPTLLIAGANDKLRVEGYANELQRQICQAQLVVYSECGHLPNIERAAEFNRDVDAFLIQNYPPADVIGSDELRTASLRI
jgi:2-hydroxymuconate-semialdehyde hydrolase